MNAPTDWLTAVVILAAGLVLGFLFLFFNKGRKNASMLDGEADAQKDLEARRDALVEQLRDPALPAHERQRLEIETAEVLRELDDIGPVATEARAMNPAPSHVTASAMKGFAWGATTFAVLGALAFLVTRQSAPRTNGTPVEPAVAVQPSVARSVPAVQQLEERVRNEPKNLDLRNDLAQAQLGQDNLMAVFEHTKVVLDARPENSRALTLQAVVRAAMGEVNVAIAMLQRAAASDPKNLDARVALAWVYAQNNRMRESDDTIALASKEVPDEKAMLEQVRQQIRAHVAKSARGPQPVAASGEMPPGHPAVATQ